MQKIRAVALILVFTIALPVITYAVDLSADGAMVMDAQSGEVYFEKNADMLMTPASLTKIMTLFVVFEEIGKGTLSEETMIPISNNAAGLSVQSGVTNVPLKAGSSLKLRTLIDAMVIVSACASCTAVAEYISGTEANFADMMNTVAAQYDLNAYFEDASGLSNKNLITPESLARLTKLFIEKYPVILNYTSKTSEYINGKKYNSTNKLLKLEANNYFYPGADGFKTGTTNKAGKCLVSTAQRDATRLISVAMHSESDYYRYADSQKLLDEGFARAAGAGSNIFATDMRVFIDDSEIPCCITGGRTPKLGIIAEELNHYGFDVTCDSSAKTIYIKVNTEKATVPVAPEKITPGLPLYKIQTETDYKAVLISGGEEYPLSTVISLGEQHVISPDELGICFEKHWDDKNRILYIKK